MSTFTTTTAISDTWQAGFMQIMPAIKSHVKFQFRCLGAERREEAVQEAIASACASYRSLALKGRLADAHPSTLATFAVNHVQNCRHVGSRQDGARDPMSVVAQARHRFRTISYDRYKEDTGGWEQMMFEDRKTSIPDLVSFRVDFADWLRTLTKRDRRIISSLIKGLGTGHVADRFGMTPGRVSQLRRKYERLWHAFQRQARELAA